jgi:hypothetical protein
VFEMSVAERRTERKNLCFVGQLSMIRQIGASKYTQWQYLKETVSALRQGKLREALPTLLD